MELPFSGERLFSQNILTAFFFFPQVSTSWFTDSPFSKVHFEISLHLCCPERTTRLSNLNASS